MKVEVHHADGLGGYEHVATVDIPEEHQLPEAALEYAWRWTQNIEGSWSRSQWTDDLRNWDWNTNVEVVKALPVFQGQVLGHRSSMVGDRFVLDGRRFRAASMGFEPE